jgi:eukaryotic-like serine/threonine-protein kinase
VGSDGDQKGALDAAPDVLGPTVASDSSPDTTHSRALPAGTRVGRYVIVDTLGSGGMGVVYRARDPELGRHVALKLVRPNGSSAGTAEVRARLVREAQAMAKLAHPNVISVFDVGTVDGDVFVAMELVDGPNLADWLAQTPRSVREIIDVFEQAGRGLEAAHAANLVHRDFKPVNVLVGRDGRVRVLDFGLARLTHDETRASLAATQPSPAPGLASLTHTGALLGTPLFMAPEQFAGGTTEERTDQFGFCVALYHALYNAYPFEGKTVPELMVNVMAGSPTIPRAGKAPVWLQRLVLRGLSVRPDARFPNMTALLAELTRRRAEHGGSR